MIINIDPNKMEEIFRESNSIRWQGSQRKWTQGAIGAKESEISAFQEMLKVKISDEPFLHTFDAMNTQENSLNAVDNDGKRYLAKLKGNQGNLQKQTIEVFEEEYKRELSDCKF